MKRQTDSQAVREWKRVKGEKEKMDKQQKERRLANNNYKIKEHKKVKGTGLSLYKISMYLSNVYAFSQVFSDPVESFFQIFLQNYSYF
jgi:hypothetical protein